MDDDGLDEDELLFGLDHDDQLDAELGLPAALEPAPAQPPAESLSVPPREPLSVPLPARAPEESGEARWTAIAADRTLPVEHEPGPVEVEPEPTEVHAATEARPAPDLAARPEPHVAATRPPVDSDAFLARLREAAAAWADEDEPIIAPPSQRATAPPPAPEPEPAAEPELAAVAEPSSPPSPTPLPSPSSPPSPSPTPRLRRRPNPSLPPHPSRSLPRSQGGGHPQRAAPRPPRVAARPDRRRSASRRRGPRRLQRPRRRRTRPPAPQRYQLLLCHPLCHRFRSEPRARRPLPAGSASARPVRRPRPSHPVRPRSGSRRAAAMSPSRGSRR